MSPLEVSNWESVLIAASGLVLMATFGFVVFSLDRHVRRKGYQSPFRAGGMILGFMAMVAAGGYWVSRSPELCWSCSPSENPSYFDRELIGAHVREFATRFSVGMTIGLVVLSGIAGAVPRRARRFGHRKIKFPWRVMAFLWLTLIPSAILAASVGKLEWRRAYQVSMVALGGYSGASYLARRTRLKGLEQALLDDARSPVLYLRSFEDEERMFTSLPLTEAQELGVPIRNPLAWKHPATLEEFLAKEINERLGPFIALGDPYDYLPPGGAERQYFDDAQWQEIFLSLSRTTRCMVDRSKNLILEIQLLRDSDQLHKLFVLTPPDFRSRFAPRFLFRYFDERTWKLFATEMERIGLDAAQYPGRGSVVRFWPDGKASRVQGALQTPADYVSAILECT